MSTSREASSADLREDNRHSENGAPQDEYAEYLSDRYDHLGDLWRNAEAYVQRELGRVQGDERQRDLFGEMLTGDEVRRLPQPPELVRGWLPDVGVAVIYSKPGLGKTFVAVDLAERVRRGQPWFGHPVQQGAVMVLEAERLHHLRERLQAFDLVHGPAAPEVADELRYFDGALNLEDPRHIELVVQAGVQMEMATGSRVRLVVVDPLIDYMVGDENAEGMDNVSRGLRVIARLLSCCVLVLHHSNAEGKRARGNDKLKGRVEAMIAVTKSNGTLHLRAEKQRSGPEGELSLYMVSRGRSLVLERASGVAPQPSDTSPTAVASAAEGSVDEVLMKLIPIVEADPGVSKSQARLRLEGVGTAKWEATARHLQPGAGGPIEVRNDGGAHRLYLRPPAHVATPGVPPG